MIRYLLLIALCGASLMQCAQKTYQAPDFPEQQLQFGSAGGFTGEVRTYYLLPNGQLFVHSSMDERYRELGQIDAKLAKGYFEQAANLAWEKSANQPPSNMNFFLRFLDGAGTTQSVEWAAGTTLNTDYGRLYEAVMEEVQRASVK